MKKTVILLALAAVTFSCKRTYLCEMGIGSNAFHEIHEFKIPKHQEPEHKKFCENNGGVWLGEK
jgi:hypothetical protein